MDGTGSILFWGHSPSLDLNPYLNKDDEATLLLLGSGDIRHILHTAARTDRNLKIFLSESQLEVYARHLLFLQLIFRSTEQLGLQEKCEHYLELLGNLHINSHTEQYLKQSATELIDQVTKLDGKVELCPEVTIDLSLLKYKEKDFLEGIFQFWRGKQPFPAQLAWEGRVRQYLGKYRFTHTHSMTHSLLQLLIWVIWCFRSAFLLLSSLLLLGTRFDTRQNAFDWDLHMKLADRGFKRLNTHEYHDWRETGLAFRLTRQDYTEVNRTLASAFVFQGSDGTRQARRGYWGDILCGPYLAHGYLPVDNDDPENEKKANDKFIKTATHISEYNVLKLLGQLQERRHRLEFVFLPLNSIGDLCTGAKERYRQLKFDLIYFGCSVTHYLNDHGKELSTNLMSPHSALILELPIFLLDLKAEQIDQLIKRYDQMAETAQCQVDEEHRDRAMKVYRYLPLKK